MMLAKYPQLLYQRAPMSVSETTTEATLFDLRPSEPPPAVSLDSSNEIGSSADAEQSSAIAAAAGEPEDGTPYNDRKRIEEQLDALKRKETELRRALVVTDHPELAEAIRTLGSRALAVSRAEAKLAQGLSKGEVRKREAVEKKLGSLRAKREELDGQIAALESELGGLGSERLSGFEAERHQAMQQLMLTLGEYEEPLRAAGLEASSLVPEISGWMPELETIAKALVATRA
jgi:chromosome segregation ATPase